MNTLTLAWLAAGVGAAGLLVTPEGKRQARRVIAVTKQPGQASPVILPRGLEPYRAALKTAAARNGMRWTLLAALVTVENATYDLRATRFEPGLVSKAWILAASERFKVSVRALATSYGLTQVLGASALAQTGFRGDLSRLFEPGLNLEIGARYWKYGFDRHKRKANSQSGREWLSLIAYNGGDGAVEIVLVGGSHASLQYAAKVLDAERRILKGGIL